ncbi:MAG TPA: amidohydrolase family protein [Candidatus Binataceae bacterium]
MRNGMRIVDTDTHQMEPNEIWEKYIDARFKSAAPRLGKAVSGRTMMMAEGEPLTAEEGKYPMAAPEFLQAVHNAMQRFTRARKANFNAQSRLEDMDEQGVDVQVLYPTVGGQLLGKEFRDLELLAACCRAYNNWSAEFCQAAPSRLRWAAMLPIQDPEKAVVEARRAASNGCVSYYVRPNPIKGRNLYHQDYWPLWAEVEKLNKPISIHDSGSPRLPSFGDRMDSHVTGHIIAHPFEAMVAMMSLIWYGIFEKFPKFTVVHVEADAGWVPYWLQRMEQHWDFSGNAEHPELKRRPTEYFKSNIFVACRADEMTLKSALELVGDDNFVWNTDYPHPDGTWPGALASMEHQAIPESSKRKILWDNAVRAFRL